MIYKKIIDQAPIAVIYLGRNGKIIVWNKKASELLGYSSEDAIGQSIDLIIPERFRAAHNAGYTNAIAKGKSKLEGNSPMKAKAVPLIC
ncbi:MAG: PAS domain S-box protein [Epsilonproteobacteria bacterium]|nr:PAS domain S-box protein [Campylobacterota bacterium]